MDSPRAGLRGPAPGGKTLGEPRLLCGSRCLPRVVHLGMTHHGCSARRPSGGCAVMEQSPRGGARPACDRCSFTLVGWRPRGRALPRGRASLTIAPPGGPVSRRTNTCPLGVANRRMIHPAREASHTSREALGESTSHRGPHPKATEQAPTHNGMARLSVASAELWLGPVWNPPRQGEDCQRLRSRDGVQHPSGHTEPGGGGSGPASPPCVVRPVGDDVHHSSRRARAYEAGTEGSRLLSLECVGHSATCLADCPGATAANRVALTGEPRPARPPAAGRTQRRGAAAEEWGLPRGPPEDLHHGRRRGSQTSGPPQGSRWGDAATRLWTAVVTLTTVVPTQARPVSWSHALSSVTCGPTSVRCLWICEVNRELARRRAPA